MPRLDLCAHLVELTMQFWQHGPDAEALRQLGWSDAVTCGGQLSITGPSGIRTAFYRPSDPITLASCLGFGQCGALWPQALPGLLKAVDNAWKAARARATQAPTPTSSLPVEPLAESEPAPAAVLPGQLALFEEGGSC